MRQHFVVEQANLLLIQNELHSSRGGEGRVKTFT